MAEKTTREDIKKIIGFMILAYPNYHPDLTSQPNAVDALFELLGDIESEKLDAAVRKACKEPGRVFAPSVGEILGSIPRPEPSYYKRPAMLDEDESKYVIPE